MEIDIQDSLHTIAEIAVALAGFTGIVIVFGSKGDSLSSLRLRTLLRASFSALFCSFVPIIAFQIDLGAIDAWQLSAGIISGVMFLNLFVFLKRMPRDAPPRAQLVSFCVGIAVAFFALLAAFDVFSNASLMVMFTLLWQLFVASQNFVLLLVKAFPEDG